MARRKESSAASGCVILVVIALVIIGGISSCISHTSSQPANQPSVVTTDDPSPAPAVDPATPDPAIPDDGTGDSGGGLDLPGDGYVSGPGVNCGLGGCHVHVLPHFGFHF